MYFLLIVAALGMINNDPFNEGLVVPDFHVPEHKLTTLSAVELPEHFDW